MLSKIKLLKNILTKNQKSRFFTLGFFMLLNSFFEIISILLILDFINFFISNNNVNYYGLFGKIFNFINLMG